MIYLQISSTLIAFVPAHLSVSGWSHDQHPPGKLCAADAGHFTGWCCIFEVPSCPTAWAGAAY